MKDLISTIGFLLIFIGGALCAPKGFQLYGILIAWVGVIIVIESQSNQSK